MNLLRRRLHDEHLAYKVVNASISGETTRGGLARLEHTLAINHPDIVIVELGGNDGLQGLSLDAMTRNLAEIITRLQRRHIKVLLVGMKLPPNYGPAYTKRFSDAYTILAARFKIPCVPFLLQGVGTHPELMQVDGIHPRAVAQPKLLDNLWPYLKPLL